MEALVQDASFFLVNLYTPTKNQEQGVFFDVVVNTQEDLRLDPNCQIIIGGDFNCHLSHNLGGRIDSKSAVKKKTNEIMRGNDLIDNLLGINQFLRIGGKPIFIKTLFLKGLLLSLANILTNTGSLKPWTFFKAEGLNVNDYLLLFGLFNSLPLTWKKLVYYNDETSAGTLANASAELKSM